MTTQETMSDFHETTSGMADAQISGWARAYSVTVIFNALLVVLKETEHPILNLMVALTSHHWITQGLLDVIVFVGLGYWFSRSGKTMAANTLVAWIVGSTIIGGLIISGYYVL